MRKALVFVAAFALVLVAGAAVGFVATSDEEVATAPETVEKPSTTSTSIEEKEEPPVGHEEVTSEEEKHQEDPPKEEPKEEPKDTTPPKLEILFPEHGQHFAEQKIAFEGITEPGARVFAGDYEADVDKEGNWRIVLILTNEGGNLATFKAIDEAGNEATASVKAYYDAPEKEQPKETATEKAFTVNQKYGTCSEPTPYDKWYGTGTPGMTIWIGNQYGEASTKVNDHGEWYLKVHFPEAPCNEWIDVVLETSEGHRKVFEFKRICKEGGSAPEK